MTIPTVAMAVNIAPGANATCNESTLESNGDPVSLRAEWTANTISLKYYNGNTEYTSNTCPYGGGITLPENNPSKPGYSFVGWRLIDDVCADPTSSLCCAITGENNPDCVEQYCAAHPEESGGECYCYYHPGEINSGCNDDPCNDNPGYDSSCSGYCDFIGHTEEWCPDYEPPCDEWDPSSPCFIGGWEEPGGEPEGEP